MQKNTHADPTEQEILTERIIDSITPKGNHWFAGSVEGYRFAAKVFSAGSQYGIDNGRVSKLWIKRTEPNAAPVIVANYERGWDKKPQTAKDTEIYEIILGCLESMPTEMTD